MASSAAPIPPEERRSVRTPSLSGRRRIAVIGSGGAGKSTFARELARRTGLPLIHLDRLYWRPGWVPTPREEWKSKVREIASGASWIIDGNYGGSLGIRLERCDAVVFFDLPPLTCVYGVLRRRLSSLLRPRPDLPEGCSDRLTAEFLVWVWNYRKRSRSSILSALDGTDPDVAVVRIRRRAETRTLLNALE